MESLERLQGLHADLIAFTQSSLPSIERLLGELRASIADFRTLLDKTKSTDAEIKAYNAGKIEVLGQEYSVNEEFRHLSNAIGTALDISEEYAGRLIIDTQTSGTDDEQLVIADVVRKYHDRRDYLLQDLRLVLSQSLDPDAQPDYREQFQEVIKDVLDINNGVPANGSAFTRKCLQNMDEIEAWQAKLNEAIQSKSVLSQARGEAFYRTLEFQRSSLFKQHEALGAIVALLFRGNYTISEDFRKLHDKSRSWQRLDLGCIHYLPAFSAAIHQYGSLETANSNEALSLNKVLISTTPDATNGPYRPLAATLEMWWTAEYSGHFSDNPRKDPDASKRDEVMRKALDDGSLEFMLSICKTMKTDPWQQPARQELVEMLLDGSNVSFDGMEDTSPFFVAMMMQAYEAFAEAWITNMPDSIRKLKSEEDDRRLKQITATPEGMLQRPPREQSAHLHLEAFLVVIAFAFESRPDAAEQFWEDPDSNLYGFLQWASRRQTVPRVSAFCEMLCAISESAENAEAAHKFLLEDSVPVSSARIKKLPTMSYQQIFAELNFYSKKVHEKAQQSTTAKSRATPEPELNEAESPVMLCCYLRLLGHLFRQNALSRHYVLTLSDFDLLKILLALSSGPIPSYLRACIFTFFEDLLTDKSSATSDRIWSTIEEWAATNHDRATSAPGDKQPPPTLLALQNTLSAISSSYDQYDAFVKLLVTLVSPLPETSGQPLPFPPDMGSSYRVPGIVPYIDFVCGQFTPKSLNAWLEDGNTRGVIRLVNALTFMLSCLTGFNENHVTSVDKSTAGGDENYSTLYIQRHPFARTMQWLFSTNVNKCLVDLLHRFVEEVPTLAVEDPKLRTLNSAVDLVTSIITLQPTFFDIVKPKMKTASGYRPVEYSGITSIEDSIIAHPTLLLDLCQYAASEHVQLSLQSLVFLERLSESARFQNHLFDESKRDRRARGMIEMIGPDGELKLQNISSRLGEHFIIDPRELEAEDRSEAYLLKDGIVSFLNSCLSMQSQSPNIAHLLLGFRRIGSRLTAGPDFDDGTSTFDALASLSIAYPDGFDGNVLPWLTHIKAESICVLKHLWSFPVSSELTMTQLRRAGYLMQQLSSQTLVEQNTPWYDKSILDPQFYFHTSAEAFTDFLSFRTHLYDYVTREIQQVAKANIKVLQEKYLSTLQGKSIDVTGIAMNHPTIYELFDFAELDTSPPPTLATPYLEYFNDIDFEAYQKEPLYDIEKVRTMLNVRCAQIDDEYSANNKPLDVDMLNREAAYAVDLLEARNRCVLAQAERISCLKSYVDMIISIVDCCPMEAATKTSFVLHMLQLVLPKLDTYLSEGSQEAVELTRMSDTLLFALANTQQPAKQAQSRVDVTVADKLFQLFRICAEGVPLSSTNPDLRAVLYSICAQYLARILNSSTAESDPNKKARSNAMDTVRSAGSQLIAMLSDDADDGLDNCRLNALDFLAQLISLSRIQNSNLIIETFVKSNILEVLLDPIKSVAEEFQSTDPSSKCFFRSLYAIILTSPQTALTSSKFSSSARPSSSKLAAPARAPPLCSTPVSSRPCATARSSQQIPTLASTSIPSIQQRSSDPPTPTLAAPQISQLARRNQH